MTLTRPRLLAEELVTPEGVPLSFVTATLGDRFAALLLDVLLIIAAGGVLMVLTVMATTGGGGEWFWAFTMLVMFLIQNFYFIWFEARGGGTTPGKRKIGIRVIDASGGPLTTDAIVVRNLTRVVEIWLPLAVLTVPRELVADAPPWITWLAFLWLLALAALPLFNAKRLRMGDLVAGTRVVRAPETLLLPDVGATGVRRAKAGARHVFTPDQLSVYGIYELQVLEDVLRPAPGQLMQNEAVRAVAARIARKIEWPTKVPPKDARRFLEDYYTALRSRLEGKLLLGKRKADKYAKEE